MSNLVDESYPDEQKKPTTIQDRVEEARAAAEKSTQDEIDALTSGPSINDLPKGQFDDSGAIDVSVENRVDIEARIVLTKEQREKLRKHSPSLFRILELEEAGRNEKPFGKVRITKHPFTPQSELFGEKSIAWSYTGFSQAHVQQITDKLLSLNLEDPRDAKWLEEINHALEQNAPEDFGLSALTREESNWVQALATTRGQRVLGQTFDYPKTRGGVLTGSEAISYAASLSGSGRPSSFPMTSSGWTAIFRPSSNAAWARYYESTMEDRASLGRSTLGVGFSTSRSAYVEGALNLALDHLNGTSFKTGAAMENRVEILKYLKVSDIDTFLTGFLVACHPDGYPIRLPCCNVGKCNHVIELDANLRIMTVFDDRAFTEEQLFHLVRNRPGDTEFSSVAAYQESLRTNQPTVMPIKTSHITGDEIRIEFENCSAFDYLESSKRWLERVKVMMGALVNDKTTDTKRAQLQKTFFNTAPMRDYAHLVKRIYIGESVIEENPNNKDNPRLDIEDYLTQASDNEVMRTAFRKAAISYMNSTLTSLVVVPSYVCPVCNYKTEIPEEEENETNTKFHAAIPVDVVKVFFNLALRRLMELSS